jgi:hypothetical protein
MSDMKMNPRHGSLAFVIYLAFFLLTAAAFSLFDSQYDAVYHYPPLTDGNIDCSSWDFSKSARIALKGKCRFYYDRWIGESNDDSNPSGLIEAPSSWWSQGYPQNGYGSYGFSVSGLKPGDTISLSLYDQLITSRVYVREAGEPYTLLGSCGDLSKTETTWLNSTMYLPPFHTVKGNRVDFAIEYGYRTTAGTSSYFCITSSTGEKTGYFTDYMAGIGFGVIVANVLFSLILFIARPHKTETLPFVLLSSSFLLNFFVSLDGRPIWGGWIGVGSQMLTSWISNIAVLPLTFAAFTYFFVGNGYLPFHKKSIGLGLGMLVAFSLACFLIPFPLSFLAFLIPLAYGGHLVFAGFASTSSKRRLIPFMIMLVSFLGLLEISMLDFTGVIGFGTYNFPSVILSFAGLLLNIVYAFYLRRLDQKALQSEQTNQQYLEVRQDTLVQQIHPHFLFNSLTLVQNRYHSSLAEGDQAVALLSENLRSSLQAAQKPTIPFSEELESIRSCIALMNMRNQTEIPVNFQTDFLNFEVPPLSIQAYVENAFKYAKLSSTPNGAITLRSRRDGNRALVTITDNGCGFDPLQIDPKNHTGIANSKFRLCYSLHADVSVESEVHRGTQVTISIPLTLYE